MVGERKVLSGVILAILVLLHCSLILCDFDNPQTECVSPICKSECEEQCSKPRWQEEGSFSSDTCISRCCADMLSSYFNDCAIVHF
jgi:hypothetical protein